MKAGDQHGRAWHGGLFLAVLGLTAGTLPPLPWPWYLLLPLLLYGGIALAVPPLRRTVPRLAVGRTGGAPLAYATALALATTGVLVGLHVWARPETSELAGRVPVAAFGSLLVAGVCFSVVNAALEELVFRWVLWEVVAEEWNRGVALVATAGLFGWGHLHGYPPGPLGAVLAGLYGLLLGLLRWWSGGLGLAVLCHVGADATIFCLLAWDGAFARSAG